MVTGRPNDQVFDIVSGIPRGLCISFSKFGRHDPVVFRADQDLPQAEGQQFSR